MNNKQFLKLLTTLKEEDCPNIKTLREKFSFEVDDIVNELKIKGVINTILTDGTIFIINYKLLDEYIKYTKNNIGVLSHLKKHYKIYLEIITVAVGILGFIIGCK
ncbi:MAG: hypothetical protein IKN83_11140 [Bacteroidaceae bacterium]|nr:hypothetical protein [Bacteroidaceae bacterium]